jgi:hypothetical protein
MLISFHYETKRRVNDKKSFPTLNVSRGLSQRVPGALLRDFQEGLGQFPLTVLALIGVLGLALFSDNGEVPPDPQICWAGEIERTHQTCRRELQEAEEAKHFFFSMTFASNRLGMPYSRK